MLLIKKTKTKMNASSRLKYDFTQIAEYDLFKKNVLVTDVSSNRPTKEVIFEDSKEIHYKLEDGTPLEVKKKVRRTKKNTPDLYNVKIK